MAKWLFQLFIEAISPSAFEQPQDKLKVPCGTFILSALNTFYSFGKEMTGRFFL